MLPEVVKTILYITRDHQHFIGQEAVELYYQQNVNRMRRYAKKWAGEIEYHGSDGMFYVQDVFVDVDELQPGRLLQYLKTTLRNPAGPSNYLGTQIFGPYYSVGDLVTAYLATLKQRAENVLPIITQLAHFHQSQIHLVQVVQTPEMARQMPPAREDIDLSNRFVARNREEAGQYLEQVKSRSYLEGIDVQSHLIISDHTTAALYQAVEQENIDLITLSAHGYSGKHQWPYGSVVNNFILYGNVALLIVQDQPAKYEQKPLESSSRERAER
ncbi:MAG: hypothetical protein HGA86_04515 [Anaerolineaceae bacterium]|nr:hypothetical protein [Anaerolineaceae bacterium]